jgi:hypothetical protein
VTSRGKGREKILYRDDDRERFLEQPDAARQADRVFLKTQRELAAHFGYRSDSSMGKQRTRLAALAGADAALAARIAKLRATLE